ncbi:MAG: HD-GYP domain-containing protein [Thermodesulfobacteriota bacterium]|nr:HD-GYP domain-containing protein [Thermodesulfobacteriota bacterium]
MEVTESTGQTQRMASKSSEAMDPELSKLGNNLINKFHVLMRISQIYDSKNVALHQFIQESLHAINTFIEREGNLSLKITGDDIFVNQQRLRYSVEGFNSFKYLLTQWKKKLIGEVLFMEAVDEGTLREFIYMFMGLEEKREENATFFNEKLREHHISSIEVNPLEVIEREEGAYALEKEDSKEVGKKVFFESIGTVKEVITHIKGNQHADMRKLKRLVRKAVHLIMEDESILLGMTTIKNYDEYTFNHSVNVAIYSLAMGRRLGFSRNVLSELGITSMLHDIGKSKIPIEVLNKPAALDEGEWSLMKKHPLMGVEIVLNLKQLGEINPKMVIGIFDHHLKNDLSGYPKLFRKKRVSLFGRIIQIADAYDAMTTPRIYKKVPYTPEQALAIMLREREVNFDSVLLKMFIGVVGIYPIGSLVLLDTHEMGIVFKTNPESQWMDRPQVILVERNERRKKKKELVDLTEMDGGDRFRRSIVKTLDPNKYHIDIAKYFL